MILQNTTILSPNLSESFQVPELPNALPANYRRSKAWRSHYLGYCKKDIRKSVFFIFVLDDTYGTCKYAMLRGNSVSIRRKGKAYLRFQCAHPKDRVTIFCYHESALMNGAAVFDDLHKGILSLNTFPAADFTDFAAQCSDSFERIDNAIDNA